MGSSTILDILGSSFVGGMLLLIMFRLNDASVENSYTYAGNLIVQQNLVSIVEVINHDFNKIGYCEKWENMPDPLNAIISATDTSISFLTDLSTPSHPYGDGIIDTLKYYSGSVSELTETPNPRDRILYRVEGNSIPGGSNLGVTYFKLSYFDVQGHLLSYPITTSKIRSIQIDLKLEDVYGYDTSNMDKESYQERYADAIWKQLRISSPNLRNR